MDEECKKRQAGQILALQTKLFSPVEIIREIYILPIDVTMGIVIIMMELKFVNL